MRIYYFKKKKKGLNEKINRCKINKLPLHLEFKIYRLIQNISKKKWLIIFSSL